MNIISQKVIKTLYKYAHHYYDYTNYHFYDDLVNEAILGIFSISHKFDPIKGNQDIYYISRGIGAMQDLFRKRTCIGSDRSTRKDDISDKICSLNKFTDKLEWDDLFIERIHNGIILSEIWKFIYLMGIKYRRIMILRFKLGFNLKDIGDLTNTTESNIILRIKGIIHKLKKEFNEF